MTNAFLNSLLEPKHMVDISELADLCRIEELEFVCERPRNMEELPDLALRIRGAWGRQLKAFCDGKFIAGNRRKYGLINPYDLFFEKMPVHKPTGSQIPKPFSILAEIRNDIVVVKLRIFGLANAWQLEAKVSMESALAQGIAIKNTGRLRTTLRVSSISRRRIRQDRILPDHSFCSLSLKFNTMLVLRRRQSLTDRPEAFLKAIARKCQLAALWDRLGLDIDWRDLNKMLDELDYNIDDLTLFGFKRFSQRRKGRPIPLAGYKGILRVESFPVLLIPFVHLGSLAHVGSHASLGLGGYDYWF